MIFVMAFGNPRLCFGRFVLSGECHCRSVEVNSPCFDLVELDRPQGELEEDSAAAKLGQLLQSAANAGVVESKLLLTGESEGLWLDPFAPLSEAVEGITGKEHVVNEERDGGAVAHNAITSGVDVLIEDASHRKLLEKMLDDWVRSKAVDLESFLTSGVSSCQDDGGFLFFHGRGRCKKLSRMASAVLRRNALLCHKAS